MHHITRIIVMQNSCLPQSELVNRIDHEENLRVCAVASARDDLQELIFEYRPQLIMINISPECSSEIMMLRQLKREFSWIGILAFSCSAEFEHMYAGTALETEVDGFISLANTPEELKRAVRMVSRGIRYIGPQAKHDFRQVKPLLPGFTTLSLREAEVFCLIGCGYATKRIAEIMDLKVKTVESYRDRIRKKLRLKKGSDLLYTAVSFMRNAARRGIDGPDDMQVVKALLSAIAA